MILTYNDITNCILPSNQKLKLKRCGSDQ